LRALRIRRFATPLEALELVEEPEPEPEPGELLVEVLASPISPMDRLIVRGHYYGAPGMPGGAPGMQEPGSGPGSVAGTQGVARVLERRPDRSGRTHGPAPGSLVLLPIRCGAWRERLCMAGEHTLALPPGIDPGEACTLRVEALSASVLLDELEPGASFVYSPGAGSVGRYLATLGAMRGHRGVGLVGHSEQGTESTLVRRPGVGAELRAEFLRLGLPTPRVGFDGSGGEASEALCASLDEGGELVVYGGASRRPTQVSTAQLVFRGVAVRGFWLRRWTESAGPEQLHARLQGLAERGLREQVVGRRGLEAWEEAFGLAEAALRMGRVVLTPAMQE